MRVPFRSLILAGLVAVGVSGAAHAQYYAPVPPLRYEAVPVSPGERFLWQPGHWGWNGRRYVWVGGRHVERRPGWVDYHHGYWGERYGRRVWVAPGWG